MNNYQNWILDELESWKQTFNNQYPDHMEQVILNEKKAYDEIQTLIEKIAKNECSNFQNNFSTYAVVVILPFLNLYFEQHKTIVH